MSCNVSSEDHSDLFGEMDCREGSKRGGRENSWERLLPWSRGEMKVMRKVEMDYGGRFQVFQVGPSLSQPVKPTSMAAMC